MQDEQGMVNEGRAVRRTCMPTSPGPKDKVVKLERTTYQEIEDGKDIRSDL